MGKEKIFKPEDFDKDPDTSEKKYTGKIVGAAIVVLLIVGIIVFFGMKGCGSDNPSKQLPQSVEEPIILDSSSEMRSEVETEESQMSDAAINTDKAKDGASSERDRMEESPAVTTSPSPEVLSDIEQEAMKVIRGDYGVGQERKDKLGTQYRPIQNRVNQLKREGAF